MEPESLICAYEFDGQGNFKEIDDRPLTQPPPPQGFQWLHFDRQSAQTGDWITQSSGIDDHIAVALLAEETRPRCTPYGDGYLLNLRGVNLNPGANPEDMVSIRLWIEPNRVISNRRLRLLAVQDIRDRIADGEVPRTPGDIVVSLCGNLLDRMEPTLVELMDRVDELEEVILNSQVERNREELNNIRHRAILLRRFIVPQRDAIAQLVRMEGDHFSARNENLLTEAANRITRFAEELDAIRDRCGAIQDNLETQLMYRMNRTIYQLSVIAGIFLPLSFVAGVLGINVGGIPLEKSAWGFLSVCLMLGAIGALEFWYFRRRGWL